MSSSFGGSDRTTVLPSRSKKAKSKSISGCTLDSESAANLHELLEMAICILRRQSAEWTSWTMWMTPGLSSNPSPTFTSGPTGMLLLEGTEKSRMVFSAMGGVGCFVLVDPNSSVDGTGLCPWIVF
ncbi:hypothetical protein U9M48_032057 [Paspalum notatum var. saurae]|uniref:Uncharacterized protein n=1 Tax=Paspalum notatum var. saurae TaxID=547442 RepID=A0AAQ3U720_PASNO